MTFNEIVIIAVGITAILTAVTVIWRKIGLPIVNAVKVVHRTYEQVMEDHNRLAEVEHAVKPNSGSSLRDAVDRIETTQKEDRRMLADHIQWGQAELINVWKNLASRDAVEAASKTAEMIDIKAEQARRKGGM